MQLDATHAVGVKRTAFPAQILSLKILDLVKNVKQEVEVVVYREKV